MCLPAGRTVHVQWTAREESETVVIEPNIDIAENAYARKGDLVAGRSVVIYVCENGLHWVRLVRKD